ncbi:hypothetical protein ABZ468_39425 [Streptomyces sp. NPDC005708]|uniref:hypothetical protein n=1 Tax=Streptomyces sp. NPDC005708 TaxID=3154564 RepID=UPI003405C754
MALRPSAAVQVVDEGLLFCGWSSSSLMACGAGVIRVWQALEPLLRDGTDVAELGGRVPAQVAPVVDTFLEVLSTHEMLMPVGGLSEDESEPARRYLEQFAPDPGEASAAVRSTVFSVCAEPARAERIRALLRQSGLRCTTPGEAASMAVFAGSAEEFARESDRPGQDIRLAAVSCGPSVIVADCAEGTGRLAAAIGRLTAQGTESTGPGPLIWKMACSVLVDAAFHLLAGTAATDRCHLVDSAGVRRLPLAPPRRSAAQWGALEDTGEPWRPRDDSGLLGRTEPVAAEVIGPFPAPRPGTLVQHPLAVQVVPGSPGTPGAGPDQAAAGADALLSDLRRCIAAQTSDTNWVTGPFPAAGDGWADFLADAAGRLLVELSVEPADPAPVTTRAARRWAAALTRLTGSEPTVCSTRSAFCPGVVLARAAGAGAESCGYGSGTATAVEHALRGLLKRVITSGPPDPSRVGVSHHPAATEDLLGAVLGEHPEFLGPTESVRAMERALPGFRVEVADLAGGLLATGMMVGRAGVR